MIEVDKLKLFPHVNNKELFTVMEGRYKASVLKISDITIEEDELVFTIDVLEMYYDKKFIEDIFVYAFHKEKLKPLVANTIIQILMKKAKEETKND
jgi:hypothetical protein